MLINKLKVKIKYDGRESVEPDSVIEFRMFPLDKIEGLLQYIKDLESDLGYTAFNVSFNVYDYEESEAK